MSFGDFQKVFKEHSKSVLRWNNLFLVDVNRELLWETYLESFNPEFNKVFRERREMDCSCCRQFVKNYGNLVAITDDLQIVSLWDFVTNDRVYQPMLTAMSNLIHGEVNRAFMSKTPKLGTKTNIEALDDGAFIAWHHLYLDVPAKYVTPNVGEAQEEKRAAAYVFLRSLEEITGESIATVLELIEENVLYRGAEWANALKLFQQKHTAYHNLPIKKKGRFAWKISAEVGASVAKIHNHSIGTLLINLSEGMDVEEAIRRYESIMAPQNYKRPKAVFTQSMVKKAQETVAEMGLLNSLGRRYAEIQDITINNVLWANRNARKGSSGLDVFSQLREEIAVNPRSLNNLQSIGVNDFIDNSSDFSSIEVLFEQRHVNNLVSLIAPVDHTALSLFKWNNGFSWAYNGNVADSMKDQVKKAGGNVDGVLRFSIRWNSQGDNRNDYDAHAYAPDGHIYFSSKRVGHGELDVDIIHPSIDQVAVENITWPTKTSLKCGQYRFQLHNYSHRGGTSGFDAQVEIDGVVYEYSYPYNVGPDQTINVASVLWDGNNFTITHEINNHSSSVQSNKVWGIATNQFHPVSVLMYSPNYWDGEEGIGNGHVFFMVNGCINDGTPNGFYNEYLHSQLVPHRKVFEALGSKMKVEPSEHQLSGLGFSTTKQDYMVVRVNGKKLIKVVF